METPDRTSIHHLHQAPQTLLGQRNSKVQIKILKGVGFRVYTLRPSEGFHEVFGCATPSCNHINWPQPPPAPAFRRAGRCDAWGRRNCAWTTTGRRWAAVRSCLPRTRTNRGGKTADTRAGSPREEAGGLSGRQAGWARPWAGLWRGSAGGGDRGAHGVGAVAPGRPTLSSEVGIIICDITNPASLDEMAKPATFVLNCVRPSPQLQHLHPCAALEREARSHRRDAAGVRTAGTLTVMESLLTLHSGPETLLGPAPASCLLSCRCTGGLELGSVHPGDEGGDARLGCWMLLCFRFLLAGGSVTWRVGDCVLCTQELVLIHGDLRRLVPCAEWLLPSVSAAELPLASELPWEQLQNCGGRQALTVENSPVIPVLSWEQMYVL
ncbi:uncharacterized protein [Vicugna pacos]|uniref:Uncharacterized protein n=1 Tax=Vicugna pacos TaxID=30538 RepID=A0ABM5C6P4_VICPA